MKSKYKVIVFDAFGTLVKIGESRSPYRKLMKWLKGDGRKPNTEDAKTIMSTSGDLQDLVKIFGRVIPTQILNEINDDILFDLKTIELYEDSIATLKNLKNRGFKIALCSNVARPYGETLKQLLPDVFDAISFSYEVQAIKPEKKIYEAIKQQLGCEMSDILFIGDNFFLDVEMPIKLGMSARLIERNKNQGLTDILSDLLET